MKYKPGLVGDLSGSLGALTASHNAYGTYLRSRGTPVNPNTQGQRDQRNAFSHVSTNFRTLTDVQQNDWSAYAESHPKTPRSGGTAQILSAAAMYACINVPRQRVGLALMTAVPTSILAVTIPAGSITVEIGAGSPGTATVTGLPVGTGAILSTAKTTSAGRRFVGSYMATSSGLAAAFVSDQNLPFPAVADDFVAWKLVVVPVGGGLPTVIEGISQAS